MLGTVTRTSLMTIVLEHEGVISPSAKHAKPGDSYLAKRARGSSLGCNDGCATAALQNIFSIVLRLKKNSCIFPRRNIDEIEKYICVSYYVLVYKIQNIILRLISSANGEKNIFIVSMWKSGNYIRLDNVEI